MKKILVALYLVMFCQKVYSFTISESGMVVLGGDITDAGQVIRISVSNLTVDLGGNVVSGGTTGIVINPNLSNITIKNGILNNNLIAISIGENCSKITLRSIEINNCSDRAIEIIGTPGNEVSRVSLEKITFDTCATSTSADFVIHADYVENLILKKLLMVNNGSSAVDVKMLNIQNSLRCIINDVICQDNFGLNFEGFHVENTKNSLFHDCQVRVNNALASFVGFRFTGTATFENTCRNCAVAENLCSNGLLIGFDLLQTVSKHMLDQCLVTNNLTTGTTAFAHCLGFNLDQVEQCTLIKCRAVSNRASDDGTFNISAGFHIGTSGGAGTGVKDSEISECVAANNKGFNDERSFGFRVVSDATGNTNNAYIGNLGIRNGVSSPYAQNQIVSNAGVGSSPGGVPSSSIITRTTVNINNSGLGISNVRVI